MRRIALVSMALALTGCGSAPATKDELERERVERINNFVRLQSKVEDMEREMRDLKRELDYAQDDVGRASRVVDSVADQVTNNARIANENAVKDMTARGVCGHRLVQDGPGIFRNERIPCTMEDLKP